MRTAEYAIITILVGIVVILAATALGNMLGDAMESAADRIENPNR